MSTESGVRDGRRYVARLRWSRMFPLADHPLGRNDLRQCLRIATAATLGFTICKLFDWNYGVFFTVYPVLLVGLVPVFNAHVARQFVAAAMINSVEVGLIAGFFSHLPLVMTLVVFALFFVRFRLMSRGLLFLFGASSLVSLSVMFHFASYETTDLHDMLTSNVVASSMAVVLAALVTYLFPDVEPRKPPPRVHKPANRIRHETLIGTIAATLSFVVFQVLDLEDSLSAQVASILILFPMHYRGVIIAARWRAMGIILGCCFGLVVQLVLYDFSDQLLLVVPLLWVCLMIGARMHVTEKVGSGVGFGTMTTVGILFGQYLEPNQDLVYSDLYRILSVCVSLVVTVTVVFILHLLLNRFPSTRLEID